MGWEVPERGRAIRVICCELARISAHMLGVGVFAMDVGAMTLFLDFVMLVVYILRFILIIAGGRRD